MQVKIIPMEVETWRATVPGHPDLGCLPLVRITGPYAVPADQLDTYDEDALDEHCRSYIWCATDAEARRIMRGIRNIGEIHTGWLRDLEALVVAEDLAPMHVADTPTAPLIIVPQATPQPPPPIRRTVSIEDFPPGAKPGEIYSLPHLGGLWAVPNPAYQQKRGR